MDKARTSPFWFGYLPLFLRTRMEGRHNLQNVVDNAGWLFADKILRMAGGLLLGVLIARYLGPSQYGALNYAAAFVALFGTFATLGLEAIVTRDLVKQPERAEEILGSVFFLKLAGGICTVLVSFVAISLARPQDDLVRLIVCITSLTFVFQSFETIDFFYKSKVQSKYSVIARDTAFVILVVVRICLLISKASLVAFVWASLAEVVIGNLLMIAIYRNQDHSLMKWKVDGRVIQQLLADSWPLILSGFVIIIYMRIDQVMLGEMIGNSAVGTYSAALRISETWYFVPLSIVSSLGPTLINTKKLSDTRYLARLQRLYNVLAVISISVALVVTVFSGSIVGFLYGDQYHESTAILSIHIWSGVFYFLGVGASQWFIIENLQKYALYRTVVGAVANIMLNLILIPKYGGYGAAIATLISQCIASYLSNLLSARTVVVFRMQTRALLSPLDIKAFVRLIGNRSSDEA